MEETVEGKTSAATVTLPLTAEGVLYPEPVPLEPGEHPCAMPSPQSGKGPNRLTAGAVVTFFLGSLRLEATGRVMRASFVSMLNARAHAHGC